MERRPEVIAYTMEKYGKKNIAQIITFGTMKAKMSIRDVGRVLNVPLAKVNQIAKLVPDDLNITIEKALEKDLDLKALSETDEEASAILQAAQVLEGSIRNTGIHAAGILVCGDPLYEHIPICLAKDSEMYVSQYSMKPVEQVGMLKVDFLGLKTLTSIQLCVDALKKYRNISIDCVNIPLEDEATFQLLDQGQTLGVFQIEDGGMQDLSKQLHLEKFEEIIAMTALYRPGPMEMIPSFIARKHGQEPIEYDHPKIESILKETYGIMVYQEQVMQIAQELASFTLSEGDVLRRAMGKKDANEMAKQRLKFIDGAVKNGISEEIATSIFGKMERFAEYGFNKSHSAAYGYITYTTAYLKAHYPGEWLAALMTCDKDDTEKVARLMHEAQQLKILCLPPDINDSENAFRATSEGIRFALSAIKGVGTQVVESICEERQKKPYSGLYDFVHRIDQKKVGKKAIELLIDAGCFDRFCWTRDECLATLEVMYDDVQKTKKDQERGIFSLFDESSEDTPKAYLKPIQPKTARSEEDLLLREKALLGLFVRGHPLTIYQKQLQSLCCLPFKQAGLLPEGSVFRMAFIVETVATKFSTKSKKKFAISTISDALGDVLEQPIWPEVFETHQDLLTENRMLFGVFSKEKRETELTLTCRWLGDVKTMNQAVIEESYKAYEKAKAQASFSKKAYAKKSNAPAKPKPSAKEESTTAVELKFDLTKLRASHILTLTKILPKTPGKDKVSIRFFRGETEVAHLQLPQIQLDSACEKKLEKIPSLLI
jgi:DNA polymerase III subunit alpha